MGFNSEQLKSRGTGGQSNQDNDDDIFPDDQLEKMLLDFDVRFDIICHVLIVCRSSFSFM